MTTIDLRIYIQEISRRLAEGKPAEVIQHCLYITQVFPKVVEVYRLLGAAYFETKNYQKAGDIFQRVLQVIPDDFMAHAGLSIIREMENKLDQAVWHLERAFEIQPANIHVKMELQRLYRVHIGVDPGEILLTHPALARLYLQGKLYPQAIAEIKQALLDLPDRTDLHLMLAQAYFNNSQLMEATLTSNGVLKQLPFCQEANRILYLVSIDSRDELVIGTTRRKLNELDPYFQFIDPGDHTSENVDKQAVSLEWLTSFPEPDLDPIKSEQDHLSWLFEPGDHHISPEDDTQNILPGDNNPA